MTVPLTRRRGRPGHDLESVLTTSVAVFTERGYEGTSIDDLARALGTGKSAIYHHVPSKDALLGLALDRALMGLEDVADSVRRLDGPAVDRLETLVRGSVRVLVERLPYVTLLLRVRGNSEVEREALVRRRRIDRLGAELVRQAVGAGELRPDLDPALTSRLLFGMVNSLTEWLRPGADHDADELAGTVAAIAFAGLRVG
ncbi:MAG TPA: TetR/AcrR family transcriptional regulator [Jatrophihabitans sp.]|uniref:TetR/AcrR family transcriptional regulator n=1 Tax=Jatrophihabitans sp. TaxID=1932789 RepID=UPI002E012BA3|nr:TetR/AcrR family transcriptional regulator [Jatrophihabitans sp.]